MFSTALLGKIAIELTLGTCLKLFCDNGRISLSDLKNYKFWEYMFPAPKQVVAVADHDELELAAK